MRRVFLLVAAVLLLDTAFFAAVAPLLPHYTDELGLTQTEAGVLSASYAVGVLVAGLPGGLLATRIGPRRTMLVGLAILAVSSLVFGHTSELAVLDAARFTQGLGGAFTWAGGFAWLLRTVAPDRRGVMIGGAVSAAVGGLLLGPVLGAAAVQLGEGAVFSAVAVAAVALGVFALVAPPPARPAEQGWFSWESLRRPALIAPFCLVALPALFAGALEVLLPLRLDELGATEIAIGGVFLAAAAVEMAISPLAGRLSDHRGRLAPIRAGLLGAIAFGVALPLAATVSLVAAGGIAAIAALAFFWAPAMAMLSDASERAGYDQGLAAGLSNLAWAGGQAGGGIIGGALADSLGDAAAYALLVALCTLALAMLSRWPDPPTALGEA